MRDEAHTDKSERPLMGTGTGVGSFSRGNVISHRVCWTAGVILVPRNYL